MKILVDTCIWSTAFRKKAIPEIQPVIWELKKLIHQRKIALLGIVRQEALSGIRSRPQFEAIRKRLRSFKDFSIETKDFERAAEIHALCQSKGLQGAHTDFLLCAFSERHGMPIFYHG